MDVCDWCGRRMRFWQRWFIGRLYTSHWRCHEDRKKACAIEYMRVLYPADMSNSLPGSPRWPDLLADGVVPAYFLSELEALAVK